MSEMHITIASEAWADWSRRGLDDLPLIDLEEVEKYWEGEVVVFAFDWCSGIMAGFEMRFIYLGTLGVYRFFPSPSFMHVALRVFVDSTTRGNKTLH